MTPRSILRKPNSPPKKGLHVRFDLTKNCTIPVAQKKISSIIPAGERHPQANDQQWRARRSADMIAALTLLELRKSRGASPGVFALPAQSVQREDRHRVRMNNCPGLTPIAPNSTPNRTWAAMVTKPKELWAEMMKANAESKATSGPKKLVVMRNGNMEHVHEDKEHMEISSEDESDGDDLQVESR